MPATYHQTYYLKHRDRLRANMRRWHLKAKYGLTEADYEAQLLLQEGRCKLCGVSPKPGRRLAIDHDHQTGKFRGLLCRSCNYSLGLLESPGWLEAAQSYLEESEP